MKKAEQTLVKLSFLPQNNYKKIGLIVLATDLTTENDFARAFPLDKVKIFTNRIKWQNPTTNENLKKMQEFLPETLALIAPNEPLDAICYSCTSASAIIGETAIKQAMAKIHPNVTVITPTNATLKHFKSLNIKKIALLTPYIKDTSNKVAIFFENNGIEVLEHHCLGLEDDRKMAQVTPATLLKAVKNMNIDNVQAVFISCTALSSIGTITMIENEINKPVIMSNQASILSIAKQLDIKLNLKIF